jgi:hypothetical protein
VGDADAVDRSSIAPESQRGTTSFDVVVPGARKPRRRALREKRIAHGAALHAHESWKPTWKRLT